MPDPQPKDRDSEERPEEHGCQHDRVDRNVTAGSEHGPSIHDDTLLLGLELDVTDTHRLPRQKETA
jgi:hypothetical protein